MPLSAGTRLGPYEILSALGAGGMGEVYRARDTKLDRAVAIKILPEAFAADTERIARFQREAKTLASLNHPNIAHIHGLEESNPSAGSGQAAVRALVMELVEGEDLAQRIARGAIPVDEALPIAKQMADALEAAHEQGIIHRDLKPANIRVRRDGTVKVLDFGLAKAMEPTGVASPSVSQSPTITTPAMTQAGMILGTAAYMSPEQARGKPVDKRADIWAFGCVLYEMLTGQRAFDGEGVSETMARVIEREPDWARLPATLSPALRTYIRRCLQKDPRQRVQAIGDVRLALEGAFETAVPTTPAVVAQRRRVALVGVAAIIASGAVIGTGVWVAMREAEPTPPAVSRLQVTPSGTSALSLFWNNRDLAVTPDGSRVIYVGNRGTQLFVRALDSLVPVAVFTGGIVSGPFVSPDGQWIGFADGRGLLKRVPVIGGPAVTIATLDTAGPAGATWGPDDTIILATAAVETGLQRVSAAGGPMTVLTRPDREQGEADHFWPEMLPGGRAVLFTITALTGGLDAAQIAVLDLETGMRKILVRGGSHAHYVSSGPASPRRDEREGGHLVYAAGSTLRAVPFDLARQETRGPSVTVVPDVVTTFNGGVDAAVAAQWHAGLCAGQRADAAHPRVGGPPGPRDADCGPAAPVSPSRAVTRRHASHGVRQRSGVRPLALGFRPDDAHASDTHAGCGWYRRVDARQPPGDLRFGTDGSAESVLGGRGRLRCSRAADRKSQHSVPFGGFARRPLRHLHRGGSKHGRRRDDDGIGREPPRHAARPVPVLRAERKRLARQPLARLRGVRLGSSRSLCAAIPGREQRSLDGVHQRRHAANLGAER